MVSGSFSLLCSRCFSPFPHGTRSLSVSREYLALPDGPGGFDQDFTCPGLLRMPLGISAPRVRGCHPVPPPFPGTFRFAGCFHVAVLLPRDCRNSPGLGSSPVARRYWGNHCCFLLLRVLRCFSSPRSPPIKGWHAFSVPGCPIRKSAHQRPFAPPRGLSQLVTSFVASGSQGIHRAPLLAYVCHSIDLSLDFSITLSTRVNSSFRTDDAMSHSLLFLFPACQRTASLASHSGSGTVTGRKESNLSGFRRPAVHIVKIH